MHKQISRTLLSNPAQCTIDKLDSALDDDDDDGGGGGDGIRCLFALLFCFCFISLVSLLLFVTGSEFAYLIRATSKMNERANESNELNNDT